MDLDHSNEPAVESLDELERPDGDRAYFTKDDVADIDERDLAPPGSPPYRRGIYPRGYGERLWTKKLISGYGTPESTRKRQDVLFRGGQSSGDTVPLHLVVDIPTANGMDSDHPLAVDDVGLCGVAIDSIDDMQPLFEGLPLDRLNTTLILAGAAPIVLGMLVAYMADHGQDLRALRGQVWNNPLSEYVSSMYPPFSPAASFRMMSDTVEYCAREMPNFRAVNLDGYNVREAGSNAVQEVAFMVAEGLELIREAETRGVSPSAAAQTLTFTWASHSDFFAEVAKFRASRQVYARRLQRDFGITDPRALRLKANVQTAGSTMTSHMPEANIARVALEALAAVLGGCQSLHTSSYDEALGIPTEAAASIALEIQNIISDETGVTSAADPLGGSWHLERLTTDLVDEIDAEIDRIEANGGFTQEIESGRLQRAVASAALEQHELYEMRFRRARRASSSNGEDPNGGTPAAHPEVFRVSPEDQAMQIARVKRTRDSRDPVAWQAAIDEVERAASEGENLLPAFIQAARARATVGEAVGVIERTLGASTFMSVLGSH